MESVSRPPHRRKHSAATNASSTSSSFYFKNPYDDVVLSAGGKAKFEAHEYAEIFSGSSSIPVLDLSGLDSRAGSGDSRSSNKLDYSKIFGGLKDGDLAAPYEELFNGAVKKTKTRITADSQSSVQESDSPHTTGNLSKQSSDESSQQSIDGIKQQFNVSFNKKTGQNNGDESNGKTHIAEFKAVPGFTYFVDGTPRPQKTGAGEVVGDRNVNSLKRGVSRTWSFSGGADVASVKSGLSSEGSRVTSRLPSFFASKEDSEKATGECSPPLFDEELDKNSLAAVSAATLKKAIDQAQESIRVARMIMERKMEGDRDGSKTRVKGRLKVKEKKENRVSNEEAYERLDPKSRIFTEVDGKFAPSLSHGDKFLHVGAAKEHGYALTEVKLDKVKQNVVVAEALGEAKSFTGLVANAECGNETSNSGKVDDLMGPTNKVASPFEEMETGKEILEERDSTVCQPRGPVFIAELAESGQITSQGKSVDEALPRCRATVDHIKEPENIAEQFDSVLYCSKSTQMQEKIMCENLRISQEDEVIKGTEYLDDDKTRFVENEEMVFGEHLMGDKLEFNNLMNQSRNLAQKNEPDSENVPKWGKDSRHGKNSDEDENEMMQKETNQWFESEQKLKDPVGEEISETGVFPEIGENVKIVHELEIDDQKLNCGHDGYEQKLPGEYKQNEIAGRDMNTFASEANETIQREANDFAKSEIPQRAEETNETLRGSQENQDILKFHVADDIDEAFDAHSEDSSTIFNETHVDDTTTIFSETQEPSDIDLNNKTEEYLAPVKSHKENDSFPGITESFSSTEAREAGKTFHVEVNDDMHGTDSLRRCASEEDFIGSKESNPFEDLSSAENVDLMDHEETMLKDESRSEGKIENVAQEHAAKINMQDLPEDNTSNNKAAEFDCTNVGSVERDSESTEESAPTSILEEMDDNDQTSNKEEVRDDLQMDSDERESVEEQGERVYHIDRSEDVCSQSNSERKSEEEVEADQTMEKNEENLTSCSTEGQSELVCHEDRSESVYSESNSEPKSEEEVETCQNMENNVENLIKSSTMGQKGTNRNEQKVKTNDHGERIVDRSEDVHSQSNHEPKSEGEIKAGQKVLNRDEKKLETSDHQQRVEAIKRGREREKDRIAVERAIREARERAFAEARERAAREKLEKASAEAQKQIDKAQKQSEKASAEAKIRAERAAVERATAEARERALEKAMSQKTSTEAKAKERVSSSSRNTGLKHSFSSSDLEKFDGNASESAQRRKARLERHQRIMERAAKALAEKNMRDLLAQKEQAERNRLAESLDADVKRWAAGKEGNLRALLSTLQYILGPESGWQAISLTEIITTPAVKKAYRKATLCVHPDKLQQRGATIQQKYICEKVFDLLKAAWNKFNSEER